MASWTPAVTALEIIVSTNTGRCSESASNVAGIIDARVGWRWRTWGGGCHDGPLTLLAGRDGVHHDDVTRQRGDLGGGHLREQHRGGRVVLLLPMATDGCDRLRVRGDRPNREQKSIGSYAISRRTEAAA